MFKEEYCRLFREISPEEALVQNTVERAGKRTCVRAARAQSRAAAALAAAVLCLSLAAPALANADPAYELLYRLSPAAAQLLRPVRKADEDNGIRLEVVSARVQGDTAEIYVTLRDLTGDRVDDTTDLFDSYSIHRPFDSSAACRSAGFDAETGTAAFLITIDQWGDRDIGGKKITFSVREFLSRKKTAEDAALPVELSAMPSDSPVQTVPSTGGGGLAYEEECVDGQAAVLTPGPALEGFPAEGIQVTAVGYVGGKLHVQLALGDLTESDSHGWLFLREEGGQPVQAIANLSFTGQSGQGARVDYCEYVFDLSPEEAGGFALYGDFVTFGMRTEGSWSVTFPLEGGD